ncbi:MAG: hypothetical protein H7343_21805 [Undibacterium sp.]|nr:hypothetical protein [Opitutaceae bacterium]
MIVGVVFTTAAVIFFIALYFGNQRRRQWHETARIALEKGQPIPAMPMQGGRVRAEERMGGPRNDIRAGLVLIAVGFGLYFGFTTGELRGVPLIAAYVPGFVGVALLVNGIITALGSPKNEAEPSDQTRLN